MRAFQIDAYNQAPVLRTIAAPDPGPGQVRLRIAACGLNFADLLMMDGSYQERPVLPFTLGMEVSGTVEALGDGVESLAIGTRVTVFSGLGGLADSGCFAADRCLVLPDAMGFIDAAAFQVAYGTSHVALTHKARLQPGETLLVLGAAGGVGLTAVEIGKRLGARVIAVARGAEKCAAARRAGADVAIDSSGDDLRGALRDAGGADVVFDPVGGDQFTAAMRATRPDGRILLIGFASGKLPVLAANLLLVKNISVIGCYWGGYLTFRPEILTSSLATLLGWYSTGTLHPHVSHVLPLERAAEALELLRSRASTGKVVVTME